MILFSREKIKSSFTKICSIAVAFMIGYWIYKYKVEDRDVGIVDYLALKTANHIEMPVASFCFKDPFINENLKNFNKDIWSTDINRDSYLEYLMGNIFDAKFEVVDYKNVTIELGDYFLYVKEQWHNSSSLRNSSLKVDHKEVFSGLYLGSFLKCFMVQYNVNENRHIKGVRLYYDLKKLVSDWSDWGSKLKFYLKAHYPGQFLLGDDPISGYLEGKSSSLTAWIKDIEILERRNSEKRECAKESTFYDSMILKEYTENIKCRVPYISSGNSFPLCNTTDEMKNSSMDYFEPEILQIPKACKRISKMRVTTQTGKKNYRQSEKWYFTFYYPKEVKIITQSKEVDFHALIGNIGGYLGLFLGKTFDFGVLQCFQHLIK